MSQSKRISSGLGKAMALFVSVPLTALPAVAQSVSARRTTVRAGASGLRVGLRTNGPVDFDLAKGDYGKSGFRAGARASLRAGVRVGIRVGEPIAPGIMKRIDQTTPN